MQTVGTHTFGFAWQGALEPVIEQLLERGLRTLQLMAIAPQLDPFSFTPERAQALRARIEAAGAQVLAVDLPSNDQNLASSNPRAAAFALEAYRAALQLAAHCGARYLTLNTGRRHLLLPAPAGLLEGVYQVALDTLAFDAAASGLGLIIENIPGALYPDAAGLATLVDGARARGHDNVHVLYDVANALAIGEDPVAGLRQLGSRTRVVHLSDTPRGGWQHAPLGSGDVDFAAVVTQLRAQAFAGDIVLEILSPNPFVDLDTGRAYLHTLGLH